MRRYASTQHHLTQWSEPGLLMKRRGGPYWDSQRIGVGCPPIETDDPTMVIARSGDWIFGPDAGFEQQGLMPGVVFTCGAVIRGDEIWMYYGAADTYIGLAVGKVEHLLELLR